MSTFGIRVARSEDAPALTGLLEELGFPAEAGVVVQRLGALSRAGETVLVGTLGDPAQVVGFVSVHMTPVLHRPTPVGRLTALVVTSQARGRGLGRALVAAAERHLAGAGCGLVEVTSNQDLAGAHAFYARLGYAITSYRFGKAL
jgi:ribosomal protein S18 acetylase RimI-like enzyme